MSKFRSVKIGVATDAWIPQVNGVVTTLTNIGKHLNIKFFHPGQSRLRIPLPYNDVKLGLFNKFDHCDIFYIATPEGTVGQQAIRFCRKKKIPFFTGFHTHWAKYLKTNLGVNEKYVMPVLKYAHRHSGKILVPTPSTQKYLEDWGFNQEIVITWRGVDHDIFRPIPGAEIRFQAICVSRVSQEKGLDDFCSLSYKIPKVLIGDGPYLGELKKKYGNNNIKFLGEKKHKDIAKELATSAVFIFPSQTDTFGLTMLEAMACGTPVVAPPVAGPKDILADYINGIKTFDFYKGFYEALQIDRNSVQEASKRYNWKFVADTFWGEVCKTLNV